MDLIIPIVDIHKILYSRLIVLSRVVFFLLMFRDSLFIVDSDYRECIVQSLSFILNFSHP